VDSRRQLRLKLASAEIVLMHCLALLRVKQGQGAPSGSASGSGSLPPDASAGSSSGAASAGTSVDGGGGGGGGGGALWPAGRALQEIQEEVERLMADLGEGLSCPGPGGAPRDTGGGGGGGAFETSLGRFQLNWSPERALAREAAGADVSPLGVCAKVAEMVHTIAPVLL
jgi:hypothetical protein